MTASSGGTNASSAATVLRRGSRGPRVRALQRRLGLRADGVFGAATERAVRRYQKRNRMRVNGRVGPHMLAKLGLAHSADSAAPASGDSTGGLTSDRTPPGGDLGPRVLRNGMTGTYVKRLQRMLTRVGYDTPADGDFGARTARSVRSFQRASDLPVDGVVDGPVAGALRQAVESVEAPTGGSEKVSSAPPELAPGDRAQIGPDGLAIAPESAPDEVKAFIAAANKIATKPYRYGGGHGRWNDTGYDCSGSVSYALHGAGLLEQSRDSTGFKTYGSAGAGEWMTIYTNAGHVYMVVAGLRFDTSGLDADGSRWHTTSRPTKGYVVRHPTGF